MTFYLELNISTALDDINTLDFLKTKEALSILHPVGHGNFFPVEVLNSDGALIVASSVSLDGLLALVRLSRWGLGITSSLLTHD